MTAASALEAPKHELKVVKHAVCTFCGCVCDDIELHANEERIVETKRACILGESWFKNHTAERLYPDALIDGKEATYEDAVEVAADILHAAQHAAGVRPQQHHMRSAAEAVWLAEFDRWCDR